MPALVDTNVLFAAASARDTHHEAARSIVRGIDHGELPHGWVTNYVVAETMTLTREKLGPEAANDLLDRLLEAARFDIVHDSREEFTAARRLFRRYPELSFVDATLVASARRNDIEALYSFDSDFDAVGQPVRLETADDLQD